MRGIENVALSQFDCSSKHWYHTEGRVFPGAIALVTDQRPIVADLAVYYGMRYLSVCDGRRGAHFPVEHLGMFLSIHQGADLVVYDVHRTFARAKLFGDDNWLPILGRHQVWDLAVGHRNVAILATGSDPGLAPPLDDLVRTYLGVDPAAGSLGGSGIECDTRRAALAVWHVGREIHRRIGAARPGTPNPAATTPATMATRIGDMYQLLHTYVGPYVTPDSPEYGNYLRKREQVIWRFLHENPPSVAAFLWNLSKFGWDHEWRRRNPGPGSPLSDPTPARHPAGDVVKEFSANRTFEDDLLKGVYEALTKGLDLDAEFGALNARLAAEVAPAARPA